MELILVGANQLRCQIVVHGAEDEDRNLISTYRSREFESSERTDEAQCTSRFTPRDPSFY